PCLAAPAQVPDGAELRLFRRRNSGAGCTRGHGPDEGGLLSSAGIDGPECRRPRLLGPAWCLARGCRRRVFLEAEPHDLRLMMLSGRAPEAAGAASCAGGDGQAGGWNSSRLMSITGDAPRPGRPPGPKAPAPFAAVIPVICQLGAALPSG